MWFEGDLGFAGGVGDVASSIGGEEGDADPEGGVAFCSLVRNVEGDFDLEAGVRDFVPKGEEEGDFDPEDGVRDFAPKCKGGDFDLVEVCALAGDDEGGSGLEDVGGAALKGEEGDFDGEVVVGDAALKGDEGGDFDLDDVVGDFALFSKEEGACFACARANAALNCTSLACCRATNARFNSSPSPEARAAATA